MARIASASLHRCTDDREAGVGIVQVRDLRLQGIQVPELAVRAGEPHRVVATRGCIAGGRRMEQCDVMTLAEHHVVVEFVAQVLPELERMLVELPVARHHVVRAHDRRVAPGIAAAQPALLQHRDVAHAVILCQVVCRGQAMQAGTHDHHVVGLSWLRIPPLPIPIPLTAKAVPEYGPCRVSSHFHPSTARVSGTRALHTAIRPVALRRADLHETISDDQARPAARTTISYSGAAKATPVAASTAGPGTFHPRR